MSQFPPVPGGIFARYPSIADTATVYVTTDGSDARNGATWQTAVATVAKAISLLPVIGGVTVGTIQLGAGTFTVSSVNAGAPGINITASMYITLQGLALTQAYTGSPPVYLTAISDTGTGDTVDIAGTNGAAQWQFIRNIAFTTVTARNAVVGTNIGNQTLAYVTADGYSVSGYTFNNDIGGPLNTVVATRCGNALAATPTGGFIFKTSPVYGLFMISCAAVSCIGFGVYTIGGQEFATQNCVFQNNVVSAMTGSGAGFYVGGNSQGLGPYTFDSTWFEGNATYGFDTNQNPIAEFYGCNFPGDARQIAGINMSSGGNILIDGCNFLNHTGESINNPNQFQFEWRSCSTADTVFVNGGTAGNVPPKAAAQNGLWGKAGTVSFYVQALSVNGAVTFFPGIGKHQSIALTANATSSSIDTATYPAARGQEMTISWIQGAGGSHTYAWPANCKFAAGTAPAASTTAGFEDNVTFRYDGTNWLEISRSVGVH